MTPFLRQFDVVLFDMNDTFMFDHYHLGPGEDFYSTYQFVGGHRLDPPTVTRIIRSTCDALLVTYDDPNHFDNFPSLSEAFIRHASAPEDELEILEHVFALHELGACPATHVRFLRQLAASHRLGIVSNICAPPHMCEARLIEAGLHGVFEHTCFSSQFRSIKPSLAIFRRAIAAFETRAQILFVGDSLDRDIRPAHSLGLSTVWIAPAGSVAPEADVVIPNLPELADLDSCIQ